MKREWKPGDVALVKGDVCIRVGETWEHGRPDRFAYVVGDDDHRPLVVIDPEDREQVERLADLFFAALYPEMNNTAGKDDLHAMQAALREFANPTPPKPDEPTGLGAVVEDAEGRRWVRDREVPAARVAWCHRGTGASEPWGNVAAVRVLSEGVPS